MALNTITDNTGYVTFTYKDASGNTVSTFDIVKIGVTSIQAYTNETSEDGTGLVTITTISQVPQFAKANGMIELTPAKWALSGTPTTPFASAATLRTQLITYFSSKW